MKSSKRSFIENQDTRKIRKILHEESKMGINANSDSETEEVELRKEIYPLSHYINNREAMIDEMFSIVKGTKLRKMLPAPLKDLPLDELKADCLIHLLGMSKKRILAILEGREIDSSSDSETNSDSSTNAKKPNTVSKPFFIKQEGCSDISDNSEEVVLVNSDLDDMLGITPNANKKEFDYKKLEKNKKEKSKRKGHSRLTSTTHLLNKSKLENSELENNSSDEDDVKPKSPKKEKTLLEILELEMRAKAIRAMLKKDVLGGENIDIDDDGSDSPQNDVHNPSSIVTPVKSYRKRQNDDVIIITPNVVTIDLTDENASTNTISSLQQNEMMESASSSTEIAFIDKQSQGLSNSSSNEQHALTNLNSILENNDKTSASEIKNNTSSRQTEEKKSSWAQRWLDSKEVKKVVSTSKICGNIRKRIKNAKLAKGKNESSEKTAKPATDIHKIQGSVDEYQLLTKSSEVKDTVTDSTTVSGQESLIEAGSSVEQVQDVTSTKNETTYQIETGLTEEDSSKPASQTESSESLINKCETVQENDTQTQSDLLMSDEFCEHSNENNGYINEIINDERIKADAIIQTTSQDNSDDIIPEKKCLTAEKVLNNDNSNSQVELEKLETKSGVSDLGDEHLNMTDKLSETDASRSLISFDNTDVITPINESQREETNPTQDNLTETETLEINITEEDREIDDLDQGSEG